MWRLPSVQAARREVAGLWRLAYGEDVPSEAASSFDAAMDEYVTNYLLKGSVCDAAHPRFVRDFQSPVEVQGASLPGARMGGDNPDNIYRLTGIAHDLAYRVTGRIVGRSPPSVSFVIVGNWGTSVSIDTIGLDQLDIGPDGSFAVTIDGEPKSGRRNHLTTRPDAKFLFVRDSFMDWRAESPLDLTIERVGAASRAPLTLEEKAKRACFRMLEEVPLYYWFTRLFSGRPPNTLTAPGKVSGVGGLATQTSAMGRLSLAPDEAAVIRYDPAGCAYAGPVLYDWWFRSIDVADRQSSLTAAMSTPDADGRITCVACALDPGVANWLDTGGLKETLALVRWQGLPTTEVRDGPSVEVRIVKLGELEAMLPADHARIDTDERARRLAERRAALLRRPAF